MTQTIRFGAPVAIGNRVFFPLIRDDTACWPDGAVATRDPVALLIADEGEWFFAPLETGSTPDLVNQLTHCNRIPS